MVAGEENVYLKSGLPILEELSLNELLNVQYDVTALIAKRVQALQNESKCVTERPDGKHGKSACYQEKVLNKSSQSPVEAVEQDSEDFILTQFDENIKEESVDIHHPSECKPSTRLSAVTMSPSKHKRKISEFSSPLNGPGNLSDLEDCSDTIIHEIDRDKENKTRKILEIRLEKPEFTSPSIYNQEKDNLLFDFNTNPFTKRAWILEDFRPNDDIAPVRRGRRKLEQFYAQVGKPEDSKRRSLSIVKESQNLDYEFAFDNLRNRSKSPPGFGRLDFPSTQEGNEDKKKSQEIIRKKTKYRFLMASNNKIPPYEREYLFKRERLNRIVDDGCFFWSDKLLQIYERC